MKNKVIYTTKDLVYRIVEIQDLDTTYVDLAGDTYNPKYVTHISPEELANEYKAFQQKVDDYGIFGYALEKWNPEPNCGYEHIDSCFGFIGSYIPNNEEFNHYIVEEMKQTIEEMRTK